MPIEMHVDADLGLVRIEASGELTLQDLLDAIVPMVENPRFEPDMPQLVDLGRVEHTELAAGHMRALIDAFAKESERIGSGRVAVYAPKPLLFGVARMFESLSERLPNELRVFRDRGVAEAWLRGAGDESG